MSEFKYWYYGIPFFTRIWLTSTLLVSLLAHFDFLNVKYLVINSSNLLETYQVWQPFTSLFYYPVFQGKLFHYAMNCYFVYYYSRSLETTTFARKPADYIYVVLFQWFCCVTAAVVVEWLPYLMDPLVMAVLYLWCRLNKDVDVTLCYILQIKAKFLPWLMLFIYAIVYDSGPKELLGIAIGHLSYFLKFQLPLELDGPALLTPPFFFESTFPSANEDGEFPPPGYEWGRGVPLQD